MLGIHPYFDTGHDLDGTVVSPRLRPHFTPKRKFVFTHFGGVDFVATECRHRRIRTLENFQRPYRESNPRPPVLWRCVSTSCAVRSDITWQLYIFLRAILYSLIRAETCSWNYVFNNIQKSSRLLEFLTKPSVRQHSACFVFLFRWMLQNQF